MLTEAPCTHLTVDCGFGPELVAGWNVATPLYQSVAVLRVDRASWVPAAPLSTYSRSAVPVLVWVPMVKVWPWVEPGVTVPGLPPVTMPPTTRSPAATVLVGPESTVALLAWAAATWSRAPVVAIPENSEAAPCR